MPFDDSSTGMSCGCTATCAVVSDPPFSVARRSMLPQRSNRCMPTPSSSSFEVTGDVNSTCSWRRRGKRRSRPASPEMVALMLFGQLHHLSIFCSAAILILGVACQVRRRLFWYTSPLFSACLVGSGTYVHALG